MICIFVGNEIVGGPAAEEHDGEEAVSFEADYKTSLSGDRLDGPDSDSRLRAAV